MNPANAKFVCSGDCGIAVLGTASAGLEHWSSAPGTDPTSAASPGGRGTLAIRFQPAAAQSQLVHTYASTIASPATVVGRFYIYFTTLPNSDCTLTEIAGGAGVWFQQSDSKLYAREAVATGALSGTGVAVTTGQWYFVDFKCVFSASPSMDMQVSATAVTQLTWAAAASASASITLGNGGTPTADYYIRDVVISNSASDYPIGAGQGTALYPTSDGSHNYNLASDFLRDGSTNLGLAATDAYTELQNPLSTTIGTFLTGAAQATSEYVRCRFANLPADASSINAVGVATTNHAASTTTSATDVLVVDDSATTGTTVASEINHLGGWAAGVFTAGVNLNVTTITVPYTVAGTGATTGAWTIANVNDLAVIFGGTDVNPDIHYDGAVLEVDYVATPPDTTPPRRRPYRQLLAH